jgi:DNA repair exonuclease SbcCD nuclease subunit
VDLDIALREVWDLYLMKVLYVGDIHAEVSSLEEVGRLVDYICKISIENKVDSIVMLGDNFHNHGIVHLQVMEFWQKAFRKLRDSIIVKNYEVDGLWSLVGNHDRPNGNAISANSMMLYESVMVCDKVSYYRPGFLFVGYQSSNEEFIRICNENPECHTVVCHQSFNSAQYDNGFYVKDGIDMESIPQKNIISGHIHAPQICGKLWYPGSPRWMTVSDANIERNVWVVEYDDKGDVVNKTPFPTKGVCVPIYHVLDNAESPFEMSDFYKDSKVTVDIHGLPNYINGRKQYFEELGFRVRTFPIKNFTSDIKESDGMRPSLTKFIQNYKAKSGTDGGRLLELAVSRISWMRQ